MLPSAGGRYPLDALEHELKAGRVRLVSVAAVALSTGERRDMGAIGRLARASGAWVCVDAAQALGWARLDLEAVDAVFASGRKWLSGPPDVGVLALRPGLADQLEPATAGACLWATWSNPW